MKKRKGMLFIVSMAVTLIAGCGNTKETTSVGEGDSQIEEGTTFTVGFDAEFPPYGYLNENGEYVGFDLSLAEEVAERNGWELKKQPIDCPQGLLTAFGMGLQWMEERIVIHGLSLM